MAETASISEETPCIPKLPRSHNHEINSSQAPSQANTRRLPCRDLLTGSRENYIKVGIPLYEASIKCDWKAAKDILKEKRELASYSITENGETALHVAASAKGHTNAEEFLKGLVAMMKKEDLALQNNNRNTALYLAAAAGNIKAVKIMVEEYPELLKIPGSNGMLPLYTAALFGNHEVVKYLYNKSNDLGDDDGWTPKERGWLLEKCVENNMFGIALRIVKKYPQLPGGNVLKVLARKPEAFHETKSTYVIGRTIELGKCLQSMMSITHHSPQNQNPQIGNASVPEEDLSQKPEVSPGTKFINIKKTIKLGFAFIRSKVGVPEKDNNALKLLRIIWEDIAKKSKVEIDYILRGPPDVKQEDKPAFGIENQVSQLQKLISERIVSMHVEIQKIIKHGTNPAPRNEDQALELQKLVSEHIAKMHVETQNIIKVPAPTSSNFQNPPLSGNAVYSNRILFVAAELGNTKFVVELIRQYPDLIWKVNDNNQTIFHIAVKHRHEGIYNLLYEIGSMKDMITPLKDSKDNNMLHLVGKSAKQKRLADVSGVALQMQRELLWFKEVEAMIPPSYRDRKNKDGLTPYELFTKEHKDLVTQGEQWMKGTANQCMVVAALIATIVFAAAFTVPGGYDQTPGKNIGIPIFHSKATFMVFVVADAISLFSSSSSILMFLSILTSRYAERDFLESLPKKLMLGLATLFLSITTMTVAFSVSFFVLYKKGLLWTPILISIFAVMPVILYIRLQYSLFVDVIRSIYGSRYLFKPRKHVLYYSNPKV